MCKLTAVRQFPLVAHTVLPLLCIGSDLEFRYLSPFLRFRGWIGMGNQIFYQISEGRCLSQQAALKAPHWKLCGAARVRGVVETSVSTASGLVSTVLRALGQHSGAG